MTISVVTVYHSGYGHTSVVAEAVHAGVASVDGVEATLLNAADLNSPDADGFSILDSADAMIFGSPTYMGSASAVVKAFMEASSSRWLEQRWANKMAGGFANSAAMNGDKQNTLVEFMTFAMQHGMVWTGLGQMPGNNHSGGSENDPNRLGASIGLMTQANADEGGDVAPPESDRQTATAFGVRMAEAAKRWGS